MLDQLLAAVPTLAAVWQETFQQNVLPWILIGIGLGVVAVAAGAAYVEFFSRRARRTKCDCLKPLGGESVVPGEDAGSFGAAQKARDTFDQAADGFEQTADAFEQAADSFELTRNEPEETAEAPVEAQESPADEPSTDVPSVQEAPAKTAQPASDDHVMTVEELNDFIRVSGFAYDPVQDIFHSLMYPWQRDFGYCRLYDEASAPISLIIDCEPIYFDYAGKKWLIELWKGQYGMTTGGEIGVYNTSGPEIAIPGLFNGTYYDAPSDEERLRMAFRLRKNGRVVFDRAARHWWLTGFKLAEFSNPSELSMELSITLRDNAMRDAFLDGLYRAGYSENDYDVRGTHVHMLYDETRTSQPLTRVPETDWLTQQKNRLLCEKYLEMTKGYPTTLEKLSAVKRRDPVLFERLFEMAKPRALFADYEKIARAL